MTHAEVLALAEQHADHAEADLKNASTRLEHIRLTTLALEARRLVDSLRTVTE